MAGLLQPRQLRPAAQDGNRTWLATPIGSLRPGIRFGTAQKDQIWRTRSLKSQLLDHEIERPDERGLVRVGPVSSGPHCRQSGTRQAAAPTPSRDARPGPASLSFYLLV